MTTHIEAKISIACPLAQAPKRLEHFFQSHGNAAGDVLKLRLGVYPGDGAPAFAVGLERDVIATVQAERDKGDMAAHYRIQWAPAARGPYPLFSGELLVEGNDDYDSFTTVLRGAYEVPLGPVGDVFDAVLGKKIALSTANGLLRQIRDDVVAEFTSDEERKAAARIVRTPILPS